MQLAYHSRTVPNVLRLVVLTVRRSIIAALSIAILDTHHVLKCGYTHSCDPVNCIFPQRSILKLLAMRKALPVLSICVFNGVLTPLPSDVKRGRGQKSPVSLLSSDLEASRKRAPKSLACLLLKIYGLQKCKCRSRIVTWLCRLQIFVSCACGGGDC